jgi:hypothetical protein
MKDVERVGVLVASKLSVRVEPSVVDATPHDDGYGWGFDINGDHSFTTVSGRDSHDYLTVTLEAGRTYLHVDGYDAGFSGVRYFPTDYEDERRHVEDAKVDFVRPDGGHFDTDVVGDRHPVVDARVSDLLRGFDRGTIEPIAEPEQ